MANNQQNPLQGLSKEDQQKAELASRERDRKVKKVAKQILGVIADEAKEDKLMYGSYPSVTDEKLRSYYQNFYGEHLIKPIMEANLTAQETGYLFRVMQQPFDMAKQIFDVTIERRMANAREKAFGEEHMQDIPLPELDAIIKEEKSVYEPMQSGETVKNDKPEGLISYIKHWIKWLRS